MADMVFLTKLKPEPMGAHDASKAYGINSLVMSADGAAAYLSVKDVPAGVQLTNAEYWKIHTDLSKTKQSAEEAAAKAMAARDEMMEIARNLTGPVSAEGNPVRMENLVGGLPFDGVVTVLEPKQAGGGEAAPGNIRPISGWTGAKLARTGKNLFSGSPNKLISNGITLEKDRGSEVTVYGSAVITLGMRVFETQLPAGTYTFSIGEIGNVNRFEPCIEGTPIAQLRSGDTWTLTLEAAAAVGLNMIVSKGADCGTEDNPTRIKVQLEIGADATAYEPYQGLNLSADFGQTVYGGRLDWQKGVLKTDRAIVVFNGTEAAWVRHDASGLMYINALQNPELPVQGQGSPYGVCSHYRRTTANSYLDMGDGEFATGLHQFSSVTAYAIFKDATNGASVDAWKAYLAGQYAAGTPVQVVYKLAAPVEIPLTPQEIKQLEGTNSLYGDGLMQIAGRQERVGGIAQETDPTVPAWAKQPNKPTYTAEEVGAQPKGNYALKSEIPSVPVQSVNGKTGAVQISASDVGAASKAEVERLSDEIAELKNADITVIGSTPLRIERNTSGVILRSDGECAYSIKSDTVIDSDTMTFVEKNGTLTHDGIYEFRPAENQSAWTGGHVTVYIGGLTIGEEYKLLIDCRDVSFDVANYISGGHYRLYKGNANANIEAQFSITENGVTEKTFVATAETQWLRIWPYDGIKYDATKSTARFRDIYINRASAGVERTEIINASGTFDGKINIGDIPAYMIIESSPACTVCKSGEETGDLDELLREYGMSHYTWQNDVLTVYQNGTKTVYGYHGNNGIMMCKGYGLEDAYVPFKTDILSPMILTASENADGDLDDSYRLTGGNHSYAQTSGTPSANTVLVEVFADGKPAGKSGLFNTLTLHARHEVQAWNTEKADGTGRAVLIEDDFITWDGKRMNVEIHLTPTENVAISEYYGLQLAEINSCNVYGSKVKKNIASGGYSDEIPYFIEGICNGFRIRMHLDETGLGEYTYNTSAVKYSKNDYKKAYFRPIGESHSFTADDCLWLRGYFEILPLSGT